MFFINDNGAEMINNIPNNFSKYFDWVVMNNTFIKLKEVPNTVYAKIDFLPYFVNAVLPLINNTFRLITACSDYSPSVNFPNEYQIIINHPLLDVWYTNNKIHDHIKVRPLPAGLCNYPETYHNKLLDLYIKSYNTPKKNKILCIWRHRDFNVCDPEYITRDKMKQFIHIYPEIFDWVEPNLNNEEFNNLLITYKYILCPVGNGVDPSPKSFEAIATNTIPIMIASHNTRDAYKDLPCILVDNFEEVIVPGFLDNKVESLKDKLYNLNTLIKLSAVWWAHKIKSC
jgi:hypothetical protein